MKIYLFSLFFYCFFSFIFAKPLELEVKAKNAILINADNNRILFEKEPFEKIYPASITKLFSIFYILEKYSENLEDNFIASENALKAITPEKKMVSNYSVPSYILETDGSHFDLLQDERLTLNDLLYGMMLSSGNDACNVVAEGLGNSIEAFMKNLNEFLVSKNIKNTNLVNPHGLHMPDHVTTAYDISQVVRKAIKNPKFLEIFSTKLYIRPKTNKQQKKEVVTTNKLLKPGAYNYKYCLGGKTGYHAKAKYNLVSLAKKNDRALIAVVLGLENGDQRYEDAKNLFDLAFKESKITKKLIDKNKCFLAKIEGGAKILKGQLKEDFKIQYFPSEEVNIKTYIYWNNIKPPIKKGQIIASIEVKTADDQLINKDYLYATESVRRSFFFAIKQLFIKS